MRRRGFDDLDGVKCWASRRSRKTAAYENIAAVVEHDVWESGTAVSAFSCGVAPKKLNVDNTNEQIHHLARPIFDYDAKAVPNPDHTTSAEITCSLRYGGLCSKVPDLELITTALCNLYTCMKTHQLGKSKLPIFMELSRPVAQDNACM